MDFNTILQFVLQPEFIGSLIAFGYSVYKLVDKFSKANEKDRFDIIVKFAIEETSKLLQSQLSNDQKRDAAIENIYDRLPTKIQKSVNEDLLKQAVNFAYHNFVKPNNQIKKK